MAEQLTTTSTVVGTDTITTTVATDSSTGAILWETVTTAPAAGTRSYAVQQAAASLQTMLGQQSALQTQLQADIASVTGTGWANLTAAEQQAIIGRILQDGLGNAMQAIVDHLTVDGIA